MPEHQQTQKSTESKTTSQKQAIPIIQAPISHPMAIIQRARINPKSLTPADVLQLQRTIGNRAVGRLLSEIGLIPSKAKQTPPVQRQELIQRQEIPEEEPLQGKFESIQRQEIPDEEELLQGKFETIQRLEPKDEEKLQMKSVVQRQEISEENDEPVQGKMIGTIQRQEIPEEEPLQPKRENNTGMPDNLKAGVENLSGVDMSDVRVHYNSSKPAEVGALAYTQGTNIHVAPGQEKHLPHEAWHVIQQAQGRVKPTMQLKDGIPVNDDEGLEHEADEMGAHAAQRQSGAARGKPPSLIDAVSGNWAPVQMERLKIDNPPQMINLTVLEQAIEVYDAQISELKEESPEVMAGFVDINQIHIWRTQYDENMTKLRDMKPGDAQYSQEQISRRGDPTVEAIRLVLVTLANMRHHLNQSLESYTEMKGAEKAKSEQAKERKLQEQAKKATERKRGLGAKWGKYNNDLKFSGNCVFSQYVPAKAKSIDASVKSQNILDAVYHTDKAFWVADPRFKLSKVQDKVKMEYTFTKEGARSLMEDYLICGSGDFNDDNEEEWGGETCHPYYTIWKTNEIGAYGIGSKRLEELSGTVTSIKAHYPKQEK